MYHEGRVRPGGISLVLVSLSVVGCVGSEESPQLGLLSANLESAGTGAGAAGSVSAADGGEDDAGLACVPSAASDTSCDGVDVDCDGRVDEDFAPLCVFGAIVLQCAEGLPRMTFCDDRNACTADLCRAGACQFVPIACDDGNPCTADSCDPELGCLSVPVAGAACEDGDACTVADRCNAQGSCEPGGPAALDDGNACTADSCDPAEGVLHTPQPGVACDDGDACSAADVCDAFGACTGQPLPDIDDEDACTDDACDPATGAITHELRGIGVSCSDGDACNGAEICQGLTEARATVRGRQTYFRTDAADTFELPRVIRLADVGFGPGREITLHTEGQFTSPAGLTRAAAVFSADSTVLGRAEHRRIPGSLPADAPAFLSGPTYFESLTTDVPEDFRIESTAVQLTIPQGARYLVLGMGDSHYGDNAGSLTVVMRAVRPECVAGEPPVVDDANLCTVDQCDAAGGVSHMPVAPGVLCELTGGALGACEQGTCVACADRPELCPALHVPSPGSALTSATSR